MPGRNSALKHRGADFRSRVLVDADFEGCDLRGANFERADLRAARFTNALVGVPPGPGTVLLLIAMGVAVAAGVMIGWAIADLSGSLTSSEVDRIAEGGTLVLLIAIFIGVVVVRGFDSAWRVTAVAVAILVVLNLIGNALFEEVEWVRLARFLAIVLALFAAFFTGILGRMVGGVLGSWSIAVVALAGGLASGRANGGVGGIVVALCLAFVAKRAMRGDARDRRMRSLGHRIARRWGTNFKGANLTGADFTGTGLAGVDMRGASIEDVRWDPTLPLPLAVDQ